MRLIIISLAAAGRSWNRNFDDGKNLKEQMNAAVTICNSQIALQASADALNLNLILLQIDIDLMQISTDFRGRRYKGNGFLEQRAHYNRL